MILYHDILSHIEMYDIICENEVKVRNDIILINSLLTLFILPTYYFTLERFIKYGDTSLHHWRKKR